MCRSVYSAAGVPPPPRFALLWAISPCGLLMKASYELISNLVIVAGQDKACKCSESSHALALWAKVPFAPCWRCAARWLLWALTARPRFAGHAPPDVCQPR